MELRNLISSIINECLSEGLSLIRGVGANDSGNVDLFGRGLYLTDDIEVAKFYGDQIKRYEISGNIFDTTKNFSSSELVSFFGSLDKVLNTRYGSDILRQHVDGNDGEIPENIDYIGISWVLNSDSIFQDIIKKSGLITNDFNSYANDCTAMNMALSDMGYVGLKYSTSEIEDLDDNSLGDRNAYLIFDKASIIEIS